MLSFNHLALRRGSQRLIEGTSFTVHSGQKIGLVGANGSGKTSLFRVITGELDLDAGTMDLQSGVRIACMQQEVAALTIPALAYVESGDSAVNDIREQLKTAEAESEFERMGHLHSELEKHDGYTLTARAEKLLMGLGFSVPDFARPVSDFSGGWRVRLNLAHTLMMPSDLLLLDEPTNHLDLDAILWLAEWLRAYQGSLLLISHDRDFLDDCVTHIAHLHGARIELVSGNYSAFELHRAARLAEQQSQYDKQQREIAHMQDFVRRFRYKASKARQAQSRIKALERMEQIAPAHVDSPFSFGFRYSAKVSDPLLKLDEATLGYDTAAVLENIKLSLRPGDRFGLLGPNGAGKSTLVKTLQGELPILDGERLEGLNLRIGYFSQHQVDDLDLSLTPLEHLQRLDESCSEQVLRNYLGGFNFRADRVAEPAHIFSGGEKARLALACVAFSEPNLLLMDEPTNHLDIDMRQALTVALQDFPGAIVVISHDRHLLAATVDEFLLVDDGSVQRFDGDLEDYRRRVFAGGIVADKVAAPTPENTHEPAPVKPAAFSHKQARQWRTRLATVEKRMARLQEKLHDVEKALADPELYTASDSPDLQSLLREQHSLREQLDTFEEEWLTLSTQLEA